ncbi:MAG: thioredoxin family protein [Bacteroidota bacterium]
MKKVFLILLLTSLLIPAQEKNKMVVDEKSGKTMVVGICNRTVFADTNFSWWYDSEYNNYEVNPDSIIGLKEKLENVKIDIVFGSWCSDSRREVPRFLKILDELKYDYKNLSMIAVNRKKEAEGTKVKDLEIKLVPTFIFYSDEKEIGRIIETPVGTLEGNLQRILD